MGTGGTLRVEFLNKVLRGLGGVSLAALIVTSTPLAYYYSLPLRETVQPEPSDVIVLMSSGQIGRMWVTPDGAQRTLGALWLYRSGYAPHIISSGSHWEFKEHQAERQGEWLQYAGVPESAILVERNSTRTWESAREVAGIMREHGWTKAVIVTSEMDTVRVRLAFEKQGIRPTFLAVPEIGRPRGILYIPGGLATFYHATYEYAGLVLYKLRGWI
jgi:uncharacterized SAM-binding protein YcdF (DUF218 family)